MSCNPDMSDESAEEVDMSQAKSRFPARDRDDAGDRSSRFPIDRDRDPGAISGNGAVHNSRLLFKGRDSQIARKGISPKPSCTVSKPPQEATQGFSSQQMSILTSMQQTQTELFKTMLESALEKIGTRASRPTSRSVPKNRRDRRRSRSRSR